MYLWDTSAIRLKPSKHQAKATLYGVNLGGWLVLERWMTPSLFAGTEAQDEYTFCENLTTELAQRLEQHRDTFIRLDDFKWLAEHGIRSVRLPIGYGVFGDQPPYTRTIDYVDRAFEWAGQTGISILLDLHIAPGSQNGNQESGRIGPILWHKDPHNVDLSLVCIEKLAQRYGQHPALQGIELLNEPKATIPKHILQDYYRRGYAIVRQHAKPEIWVVFSDSFTPRRWRRSLRPQSMPNLLLDTHQYQAYTAYDKRLPIASHVHKTLWPISRRLRGIEKGHPFIVGEWSLALHDQSLDGLTPLQHEAALRAYAASQLLAFERADAWYFWSYKTEAKGVWSFRDCVDNGWLPSDLSQTTSAN